MISAGATLALGRSFSASRFWDEVTRYDATAFVYIGEVCRYLLNQPEKDTDRTNKVRVIGGNGLRPDIWDEFTARFNIPRVFEFYGASEGNTGFVNIFHIPKTAGICPTAVAFVEYDPETGEPVRDDNGRVRKVRRGQPGLLLSKITKAQPFDGYTDPEASEKKLVRNAFRDGDVWLNSGDLLRPQGWRHAVFVDRLGDTFRWKGENVATTDVEAAVAADPAVEAVTVFGVKVPGADGRAGMAAVVLDEGKRVRRRVAGQDRIRASARLRGAAVRAGRRFPGAHRDGQGQEGRSARAGLWSRRRRSALRAQGSRRRLRAVLRRVPRRSRGRKAARGLTPPQDLRDGEVEDNIGSPFGIRALPLAQVFTPGPAVSTLGRGRRTSIVSPTNFR